MNNNPADLRPQGMVDGMEEGEPDSTERAGTGTASTRRGG